MEEKRKCLVCQRTAVEIPLLKLEYGDQEFYICPQDLPTLIHQPHKLIGKLPGAEKLDAHE